MLGVEGGEFHMLFLLLPLMQSGWEGELCCSPGKDIPELILNLRAGVSAFLEWGEIVPPGVGRCVIWHPFLTHLQVPWVLVFLLVGVGAGKKIDLVCALGVVLQGPCLLFFHSIIESLMSPHQKSLNQQSACP